MCVVGGWGHSLIKAEAEMGTIICCHGFKQFGLVMAAVKVKGIKVTVQRLV